MIDARAPVPEARSRRVDADVVAILAAATVVDHDLRLAEALPRAAYTRVRRVIELAGGRWDGRREVHVFRDKTALEAIEPILVAGVITLPPDLGWFPTPSALAAELVRIAGVRRGMLVLEPSAGEGAIVAPLLHAGAEVLAIELDPGRAAVLAGFDTAVTPLRVTQGDFMERVSDPTFDRVVMNPPFAPRSMDAHHVRHAFRFLAPGGRLVAVMSAGMEFRRDRVTDDLRDLVHGLGGTIEPLPDGSFKASGTDVRTVLVTVCKPKGSAS